MLSEQELYQLKHRNCELCNKTFSIPTLGSRVSGGVIVKGVPLCNQCYKNGNLAMMARYQNAFKRHLTEGEKQKILRSKTIGGPRSFKYKD